MASLKSELLPYLIRQQFSRQSKKVHAEADDTFAVETPEKTSADLSSFFPAKQMDDRVAELSSSSDVGGSRRSRQLRCYAHVAESGAGVACVRANNLHTYVDLTRQANRVLQACAFNGDVEAVGEAKLASKAPPSIHPTSLIQPKAQVIHNR